MATATIGCSEEAETVQFLYNINIIVFLVLPAEYTTVEELEADIKPAAKTPINSKTSVDKYLFVEPSSATKPSPTPDHSKSSKSDSAKTGSDDAGMEAFNKLVGLLKV